MPKISFRMNKVSIFLDSLLGMDFRAALILLPIIFKESVDHHIMMGEVCISSTLVFLFFVVVVFVCFFDQTYVCIPVYFAVSFRVNTTHHIQLSM